MSTTVLLGPVVLQDFEIPGKITWGGEQRVAVHRLPGGARVIDVLGRDDAPIAWSGIFSGSDAAIRARAVDLLRVQGAVLPLAWDGFFYSVVITRLDIDYSRSNWLPYSIACTVLRDEAEQPVTLAVSDSQAILDDLTAASVNGAIDTTAAQAAVQAPGAATAATSANAAAISSLGMTSSSLAQANAVAEATLATPLGATAGPLSSVVDAAGILAIGADAQAYLSRATVNLSNALT